MASPRRPGPVGSSACAASLRTQASTCASRASVSKMSVASSVWSELAKGLAGRGGVPRRLSARRGPVPASRQRRLVGPAQLAEPRTAARRTAASTCASQASARRPAHVASSAWRLNTRTAAKRATMSTCASRASASRPASVTSSTRPSRPSASMAPIRTLTSTSASWASTSKAAVASSPRPSSLRVTTASLRTRRPPAHREPAPAKRPSPRCRNQVGQALRYIMADPSLHLCVDRPAPARWQSPPRRGRDCRAPRRRRYGPRPPPVRRGPAPARWPLPLRRGPV